VRYLICDIDGTFADSSHRNVNLPAYTGKHVTLAVERHGFPVGTPGQVLQRVEREDCNQTIVTVRWLPLHAAPMERGKALDQPYLWDDFMAVTGQDFHAWHAGMALDKPIHHICWLLKAMRPALVAEGIVVLWLTSRWKSYASDTQAWLEAQGIWFPGDELEMREDHDERKDTVMKGLILDRMEKEGHSFFMALEDRQTVANYLRERGIPTLHVADYQ
jgi:hypothetical protein